MTELLNFNFKEMSEFAFCYLLENFETKHLGSAEHSLSNADLDRYKSTDEM